jgi:hypothetical protein
MAIDVKIQGGGDGYDAKVSSEYALSVQDQGLPPIEPIGRGQVFRQFLTNGGAASDSNDMQVDGSSTAVEFWVPADSTDELYISSLSFVIADASATLDKFGNITALTNGCDLEYFSDGGTKGTQLSGMEPAHLELTTFKVLVKVIYPFSTLRVFLVSLGVFV